MGRDPRVKPTERSRSQQTRRRARTRLSDRQGRHNGHDRRAPRVRHGHTAGRMGGQAGRQFRSLLETERRRLLRELQAISRRAALIDEVPRAGAAQGDDEALADAASQTLERDRDSAVEASLRAVLDEVEQALARIRRGTYGVCMRCRRPIAVQRLQAIPYATLCIACKQDEERHRGTQAPFREWRVLKAPRDWDDEEAAEPGEERRRRGRRDIAA